MRKLRMEDELAWLQSASKNIAELGLMPRPYDQRAPL